MNIVVEETLTVTVCLCALTYPALAVTDRVAKARAAKPRKQPSGALVAALPGLLQQAADAVPVSPAGAAEVTPVSSGQLAPTAPTGAGL